MVEEAKGINKKLIDLIIEIVIIFTENNNATPEDKVILDLATSIYEKAESVLLLIDNKSEAGTKSIIRSIFESNKNLRFFIESNTEERITAYTLSILARMDKVLNEKANFNKEIPPIEKIDYHTTEYQNYIKCFNPKLKLKKITPDSWRSIVKKRNEEGRIFSLKELCEYLGDGDLEEYLILYAFLCQEAHGAELYSSKLFKTSSCTYENTSINMLNAYLTSTINGLSEYYKCLLK